MSSVQMPQSRSVTVILYRGRIYIFPNMLVNRLGTTPMRLLAHLDTDGDIAVELGRTVRLAIGESLPWVEREEFDSLYGEMPDPVSQALGVSNRELTNAGTESGRVSVNDWPDRSDYVCNVWVRKGTTAKPIDSGLEPLSKDCSNAELGGRLVDLLGLSRTHTLAANSKAK